MEKEALNRLIKEEGDEKLFFHKGIKCSIIRHPSFGNLLGYIDLLKAIPQYGKGYDEINIQYHGGLTYSSKNDEFWRIGFDCAHAGDLSPYIMRTINFGDVIYRDMKYVEYELISMVEQLDDLNDGLISKLDKKRIREEKLKGLVNE